MATASQPADPSAAAVSPPAQPDAPSRSPYVGVAYFHGIGSQRRYEEASYLIDQIDRYLDDQPRDDPAGGDTSLGLLRGIKARVEPLRSRSGQAGTVTHIEAKLTRTAQETDPETARFYEIYWAPIMAEQKSAWGVVKWIFKQPLRPRKTLLSPWRERQRLRRSALVQMFEHDRASASDEARGDYRALLQLYDEFEGLDQLRQYPQGSFDQFLSFVRAENAADSQASARRQALAQRWRRAYRQTEFGNAALLATMALALLLLAGGLLVLVLFALQTLLANAPLAALLQQFGLKLQADWATASGIVVFLAGFLGISAFLTDYLGDVEAWATYEETDAKHMARTKVLDRSYEVLTHMLMDERCQRVVIIAHSLGTSIAHDALLGLARRNRAVNASDPMTGEVDLGKIEHFVTLGSPIDKIEYFFESYVSNSHRYKRVVEDLRGDIGREPFSHGRKPHIHWINFWDQGDPISGPLHSPAGSRRLNQRVDNVHVASYRFPAPGPSHAGYFTHAAVIGCLAGIICRRAASFRTLTQPARNRDYDYESVYLGLGEPPDARIWFIRTALALPWAVLVAAVSWMTGAAVLACWAGILALALFSILLAGAIASAGAGHRNPIPNRTRATPRALP